MIIKTGFAILGENKRTRPRPNTRHEYDFPFSLMERHELPPQLLYFKIILCSVLSVFINDGQDGLYNFTRTCLVHDVGLKVCEPLGL
jgi:hypothetical protein